MRFNELTIKQQNELNRLLRKAEKLYAEYMNLPLGNKASSKAFARQAKAWHVYHKKRFALLGI